MVNRRYKHICVTDLDGTLLNGDHQISEPNLQNLIKLGEQQVCRVAATGRSLYSMKKVLTPDMPFDYVIFSTGAGIMNWSKQTIIQASHIEAEYIKPTFQKLIKLNQDFMFHAPIPENHRFVYVPGRGLPDFYRRISLYEPYSLSWDGKYNSLWQEGTQFMVVADNNDEHLYLQLINLLKPLKVIRTTSPLDHYSLWLEIFAPEVSKGSAVQSLLDLTGLNRTNLMVIGNDFNDYEMLKLTQQAYVTENAPYALKQEFKIVADYNNHGFADAVSQWLDALS
jgi:hypothetical protein